MSLLLGMLFFMLITGILFRKLDERDWNKGRCKCGGAWRTFDMDSQGGFGHTCDKCGKTIWTSWIDTSVSRLETWNVTIKTK